MGWRPYVGVASLDPADPKYFALARNIPFKNLPDRLRGLLLKHIEDGRLICVADYARTTNAKLRDVLRKMADNQIFYLDCGRKGKVIPSWYFEMFAQERLKYILNASWANVWQIYFAVSLPDPRFQFKPLMDIGPSTMHEMYFNEIVEAFRNGGRSLEEIDLAVQRIDEVLLGRAATAIAMGNQASTTSSNTKSVPTLDQPSSLAADFPNILDLDCVHRLIEGPAVEYQWGGLPSWIQAHLISEIGLFRLVPVALFARACHQSRGTVRCCMAERELIHVQCGQRGSVLPIWQTDPFKARLASLVLKSPKVTQMEAYLALSSFFQRDDFSQQMTLTMKEMYRQKKAAFAVIEPYLQKVSADIIAMITRGEYSLLASVPVSKRLRASFQSWE